jgi:prolactin regulatory element-binding protein
MQIGAQIIFRYSSLDASKYKCLSISNQFCYIHDSQTGANILSLEKPILHKTEICDFRACRFGKGVSEGLLFIAINTKDKKKSYIGVWKLKGAQWVFLKYKRVAKKPITAFAISPDGSLLSFGTSDLSVHLCSTTTLCTYKSFKNTHGFPVTCIEFNSTGELVVSGSAVFFYLSKMICFCRMGQFMCLE